MSENESTQFEVHDKEALAHARSIMNATESPRAWAQEVIAAVKRVKPDVMVILGGPEVSYETETQPIVQLADHVITGEADLAFADLCRQILAGTPPASKSTRPWRRRASPPNSVDSVKSPAR